MTDYPRQAGNEGMQTQGANQNPVTPANSIRTRAYAASGGNVSMNITTGGPHILLFERDQQLVVLLTSELQLAGYECHSARTAVEVFDAIARYPVRLVLVNLAQAAAARREFWVALDTQRRGRGVQVLTFHCTNLAGYGPSTEDSEERSHTVLADMEVDGMLGVMNMVNTIRSRIAVSNTSGMSRLAGSANASSPAASSPGAQITVPVPSVTAHAANANQPARGTAFANPPSPIPTQAATPVASSSPPELPRTPTPNYTDKIRAVIYPNQRSWSSVPARDSHAGSGQISTVREQQPKESGLAQLSRMVEEYRAPTLEEMAQELGGEPNNQFQEDTADVMDTDTAVQQQVRPGSADAVPLSAMALRASPIQDMPSDRTATEHSDAPSSASAGMKRPNEIGHTNYTAAQSSPTLMSITTSASSTSMPVVPPTPVLTQTSAPSPLSPSPRDEFVDQTLVETTYTPQFVETEESPLEEHFRDRPDEEYDDSNNGHTGNSLAGPMQKAPSSDNAFLLDIVQSLPAMVSPLQQPPSAQPQVHNGRATRSLGSVLLDGHLVPQNRLEVAQGIQRMLRGVDLNYQLGEILLMFKLLTPDQLLAATLVSQGLITAIQISALGRIRQELHSIGLEYDLENLLVLFRILTPEQLREARTSWVG